MPTGYTHNVGDGTLTEFRDFALQCARAFGALITMRDAPADAPIPDVIEPSSYYSGRLAESEALLAALDRMGDDEIRQAAQADNDARMEAYRKRCQDVQDTRDRYLAMLEKVQAWTPPTPDHERMKSFMAEQLADSIACDCSYTPEAPVLMSATDWLNARLEDLKQQIETHRKNDAEERRRAAERTAWVAALRASLPIEGARQESEAAA